MKKIALTKEMTLKQQQPIFSLANGLKQKCFINKPLQEPYVTEKQVKLHRPNLY